MPITHQELIAAVIARRNDFPYLIIDDNNRYEGWVSDFRFNCGNNEEDAEPMNLDLTVDADIFLLFVLASAWSRTGPWENAAILTAYLKHKGWGNYQEWIDNNIVNDRREDAIAALTDGIFYYTLPTRRQVSFRRDTFTSIGVLANNWNNILQRLNALRGNGDEAQWIGFMIYLRSIPGLGVGNKSMMIKIPLILRELRCSGGVWANIPGNFCCVADARVINAAANIIGMPGLNPHIKHRDNPIGGLIQASTEIYNRFGDLYDIPLFAYEDIQQEP
jgi:hypothetical protein